MVLNDLWNMGGNARNVQVAFSVREAWGETTVRERAQSEIPLSFVDRLAVTFV